MNRIRQCNFRPNTRRLLLLNHMFRWRPFHLPSKRVFDFLEYDLFVPTDTFGSECADGDEGDAKVYGTETKVDCQGWPTVFFEEDFETLCYGESGVFGRE